MRPAGGLPSPVSHATAEPSRWQTPGESVTEAADEPPSLGASAMGAAAHSELKAGPSTLTHSHGTAEVPEGEDAAAGSEVAPARRWKFTRLRFKGDTGWAGAASGHHARARGRHGAHISVGGFSALSGLSAGEEHGPEPASERDEAGRTGDEGGRGGAQDGGSGAGNRAVGHGEAADRGSDVDARSRHGGLRLLPRESPRLSETLLSRREVRCFTTGGGSDDDRRDRDSIVSGSSGGAGHYGSRRADRDAALTEGELSLLEGTLDMRSVPVSARMIPLQRVFMLPADAVLDGATLAALAQAAHSRVPVFRGSNRHDVAGVLLVKLLLHADRAALACMRARDLPVVLPLVFPPQLSMLEALRRFQTGKSHMAVVTKHAARVERALARDRPLPRGTVSKPQLGAGGGGNARCGAAPRADLRARQ
jgi:hypothetical protein